MNNNPAIILEFDLHTCELLPIAFKADTDSQLRHLKSFLDERFIAKQLPDEKKANKQ